MQKEFSPVGEVFFALCKTVDTPLSLGAWLRYKYSCHDGLATLDANPRAYTRADAFADDYLITSFLRKWKGLKTGIDLEAKALQSFTLSEEKCYSTNWRLKRLDTVPFGTLHEVYHLAQRKISNLLGPFSMFCVTEGYGWGPGATVEIPRHRAFLDTKMSELPITVSRGARSILRNTIETDRNWLEVIFKQPVDGPVCLLDREVFRVVDYCKITTVPKSATTDRTIAIEPRGNAFLQKGFGSYFRDRLLKAGIDLSDQGRNQELARRAYFENLATLDLKAASDTVSTELVFQLLPYDWACAMDSLRSRWALMPDKSIVELNKFSSMGNGFTFELESLIFWALAKSVSDLGSGGVVSVYGDDLIVDRRDVSTLSNVLRFSGFELNTAKSYVEGDFFESCGKHYFQGEDVTPVYQKEIVVRDNLSMIRLGNRLMRLALRRGSSSGSICPTIVPAWKASWRYAGRTSQFYMPATEEGDNAWALPFDVFPQFRIRNGSLRCKVASKRMRRLPAYGTALYAWSLRRGPARVKDKFFPHLFSYASGFSLKGVNYDAVEYEPLYDVADDYESFDAPPERLGEIRASEWWVPISTGFSSLTLGQ